jgi:hypothetical protein
MANTSYYINPVQGPIAVRNERALRGFPVEPEKGKDAQVPEELFSVWGGDLFCLFFGLIGFIL